MSNIDYEVQFITLEPHQYRGIMADATWKKWWVFPTAKGAYGKAVRLEDKGIGCAFFRFDGQYFVGRD